MFQGLRQGATLYILERKGAPSLKTGTIVEVKGPTARYVTPQTTMPLQMPIMEQVVDITAELPDGRVEYKQLPALASVANFGGESVILADSQQAMSNEVAALRNSSQSVVDSVEYHRGVVEACTSILDALNPAVARERERDNELALLRQQMAAQSELIARLEQTISAASLGAQKPQKIKENGNGN